MNYLVLVNKNNKIKESFYKKVNMIKTSNFYNEEILIEKETYKYYLELKDFLKQKNIYIGIDSCYRDENEQQAIITKYLEKYGTDYINKYVAPVGYSEHHTSLAIDINLNINGKFLSSNEERFEYDYIFRQIHKYLSQFGFILRYPKDKEKLTGYNYEPWHIRFVGKAPAKLIYENNLCLEEYLNDFGCVLVVNKEKNMTSFDVVNKVRHILGIKKIGHTGTLDPLACGVLVLTIGKYTKLGEDLVSLDKEYIASVKMGILTDTLDITGNITQKNNKITKDILPVLKSFEKKYNQEVPKYSAIKINGKKLYEYARRGEDIILPKKEVTIKEIELLNKKDDIFAFRTVVSKGTYIRSLIRDIGVECDTLMTMTDLQRIRQGKFKIDDSYTLNEIENGSFKTLNISDVLNYQVIQIDENLLKKINNGVPINNTYNINDKVIFKYKDNIIAIYKKENDKLKMYKKL